MLKHKILTQENLQLVLNSFSIVRVGCKEIKNYVYSYPGFEINRTEMSCYTIGCFQLSLCSILLYFKGTLLSPKDWLCGSKFY